MVCSSRHRQTKGAATVEMHLPPARHIAEMIAPHRSNRKRKTGVGCVATNGAGIVERFFAWIQWRRRLLVRWEYYPINFLGFVQLAAICILLRQF